MQRLLPPLAATLLLTTLLLPAACAPRISLFSGASDPLEEYTLQGDATPKIALIYIRGVLSTDPESGAFGESPSIVQEVASRLDKAAQDPDVGAVVLVIDSPGGTVTASDILHHLVLRHKEQTGRTVVAALLTIAASGGYYTAAAADEIIAHPTTITGSIGTVMLMPRVTGLMDTLGIEVDVIKSGEFKDMASPFREPTPAERDQLQTLIAEHNAHFLAAVAQGRHLTPQQLSAVSDARILTAQQALDAGLVDSLGYLEDALNRAITLAHLPEDARVIVYRHTENPDDTPYNTSLALTPAPLVDLGLARFLAVPRTGFYYLWAPEFEE